MLAKRILFPFSRKYIIYVHIYIEYSQFTLEPVTPLYRDLDDAILGAHVDEALLLVQLDAVYGLLLPRGVQVDLLDRTRFVRPGQLDNLLQDAVQRGQEHHMEGLPMLGADLVHHKVRPP